MGPPGPQINGVSQLTATTDTNRFGKGAIQYPLRLSVLDEHDDTGKPKTNKSGAVRLTIAKLIAPRGGAINGVGISPHILEADPTRQLELAVIRASELVPTSSSRPTMMQMMPPMMPPLSIGP